MSVAPSRSLVLVAAWITVGLAAGTSFAQAPADPGTIRDYCIKVAPGKVAEYEAFLKDVTIPLSRARAEAAEFEWLIVARGVFPAGSSARCDYRIVYGYKGLPPEAASRETITAALKSAKATISFDEMVARRDALTHLVGVDLWYAIEGVGADVAKDNYVVLNHNTVKDGQFAEWQKLETTYWKPLVQAWLKAGGKGVMEHQQPEVAHRHQRALQQSQRRRLRGLELAGPRCADRHALAESAPDHHVGRGLRASREDPVGLRPGSL